MPNGTCGIIDGAPCPSPIHSQGLCKKHYNRWKRHGDPLIVNKRGRPKSEVPCTADDDCEDPPVGWGMCDKHYRRWRKTGDPSAVKVIVGDTEARFWSKVNKDGPVPAHRPELGPCWVWTDPLSDEGYGRFTLDRKLYQAHTWGYCHFVRPIPDGLEPDHLCRNRACVNYESHLEPVTRRENVRRGVSFKFSDELVASLYARWLSGETKASLAREAGMGQTSIARRFRDIAA
jgi:hypothetical protein